MTEMKFINSTWILMALVAGLVMLAPAWPVRTAIRWTACCKARQQALDKEDITPILKWSSSKKTRKRTAGHFRQNACCQKNGQEARDLVDMSFSRR
jgi:hypothetical protein